MAKNHVQRGLVTLSAAAIAVVYAARCVHTQAADAELGATGTAITTQVAATGPLPQTTAPTTTVAAAPSKGQPTPKPSVRSYDADGTWGGGAPAGQTAPSPARPTLKDGTYTGVGNSRRGGVQVSVAVQGGRIATVNITRASTAYPRSDIAPLLREVVSRQSAQVDFVSGATYSSMAFGAAVQQALSHAQP